MERHQPSHVIGGTQASYIIATTDGGASWSEPAAPFRTKSLCSPPWLPSCFYVGGSDISQTRFEVWRTNDVGGSWSPVGDGLPGVPEGEFWWMAMHLEGHPTEAVLYLALEGSGVWQCDAAAAAVPEHTDGSVAKHELALYPNPFHGNVTCSVQVPRPGRISLQLFDTSGRRIRLLREGFFPTGTHRLVLSEADLDPGAVSGIYFIKLSGGGSTTHHRLVYLK